MSFSPGSNGSSLEDTLYQQARGVHGKEFEEWVGSLREVLQSSDRGPGCLTLLRQLYVLTAATKYSRNLSTNIFRLLQSLILEPEQGGPRVRLLASVVLQDLSPSRHVAVSDFKPPVEMSNVPYFLPVLLAQTNCQEKLSTLAPKLVNWLMQPGSEEERLLASLSCFHTLCSHGRGLERVPEDRLRGVSGQLGNWLRGAGRNTYSLPSSSLTGSLFKSGAKRQVVPFKEIDGTVSQDIFTVLCIGESYSLDHLLNISTFSFLRRWFLSTLTGDNRLTGPSPSPAPTPTHESLAHGTSSYDRQGSLRSSLTPSQPHPFTTSLPSPLSPTLGMGSSSLIGPILGGRTKQGLKDSAVQYCLRVIDQCERRPSKSVDDDLIDACLYECIALLDILCSLSRSLINGVFPTIRRVYSRCTLNPIPNARLLLALVKFFLNHGESEMYDSEGPVALFFGQVLASQFNDPGLAYDTVEYLVDNLEALHGSTNILTKYFPNILKILAWFPTTFIAEFLQLLPSFISKATASEVLHSTFDLPCLSATLQANHLLQTSPGLADTGPQVSPYAKCLAAFQEPTHKLMFGHFQRSESGRGDTIDKLKSLVFLLEDFSEHQRVVEMARVTPLLIKLFFKTVLFSNDREVLSQLVTVVMERSVLLYKIDFYQSQTRVVMSDQLMEMFKLHSHFVIDFKQEIVDFLSNLRSLNSAGEHFYMHLVWALGEYSHAGYDSRCTTALLSQYFETLESMGLEASLNLHQSKHCTTRLVLVIMSSVAKIASRCQDLIPRALLCLNKILQIGSEVTSDPATHKMLLSRANELVHVLKIPSIASAVLTPPTPHSGGDQDMNKQKSIAYLLQSVSRNIKAE
ncbi:AP-5 complex subunit zeta-1-like [Halichondria panicea]|uniref:AP-5 complex subunit zeta-1-like n=1 Tax=Halichondria panicea TaxID=6063 RepID=UPI00312B8882